MRNKNDGTGIFLACFLRATRKDAACKWAGRPQGISLDGGRPGHPGQPRHPGRGGAAGGGARSTRQWLASDEREARASGQRVAGAMRGRMAGEWLGRSAASGKSEAPATPSWVSWVSWVSWQGARHAQRASRLASEGERLDFLGLDLLEDVALEVARTAEKAHLGMRERDAKFKAGLK